MKVVETRRKNGMKWRRYRTEDGRTVLTYELPVAVLRGVAPASKLAERLAMWENGERLRARAALVRKRIAEGVKPEAIAHEVGMTASAVHRIRRQEKERELRDKTARTAKLRKAKSKPAQGV